MHQRPIVGVAVIVRKNNKILLGKRKFTALGKSTWAFPGGHLELWETIEQAAKREVLEEAGIRIKNLQLGTITDDFYTKEGKHYITIFFVADFAGGVPKVLEPQKCERWEWVSWNNLPSPLFLPVRNLLKQNFNPFTFIQNKK